jgi:hypothetical protein
MMEVGAKMNELADLLGHEPLLPLALILKKLGVGKNPCVDKLERHLGIVAKE